MAYVLPELVRKLVSSTARPLQSELVPSVEQDAASPGSRALTDGAPAGATLVLACAREKVRSAAPRWLAAAGFEVLVAKDGDDALRLLTEHPGSVLLTDLTLRDSQARLIIHAVRELSAERDIPVLALCDTERLVDSAIDAGAVDVVSSPYNWRLAGMRAARIARAMTVRPVEASRATPVLEVPHHNSQSTAQDPLTGLPGRPQFEAAVDRAVGVASNHAHSVVALFDIDRFGAANRALGRAKANTILQQFAQQLSSGVRSDGLIGRVAGASISMVARLDGDLFGVLITGIPTHDAVVKAIHLLHERCTAGLAGADSWFALSSSVGVAIGPADGRTASDLLVRADLALERAKSSGGVARFHDEANYRDLVLAGPIARSLSSALARNEFHLDYQPFLDGRERRVCAAEALLRWDSAELGSIPPSTFVPLAEESGLMVPIGTWVLTTACRQLRAWMDHGLPPIRMSVNVSLCQLVRPDFVRIVSDIIKEARIEPHLLELELSERGALRNDPDILGQLRDLKKLGVRLALDDFGTGNSTIVYLKDFPIDIVKIDRSFVSGVVNSQGDAAITSATIAMARELGLDVVAEGVEERSQVDFLRLHGCDHFQGYLISPPVSPVAFGELLGNEGLAHWGGY